MTNNKIERKKIVLLVVSIIAIQLLLIYTISNDIYLASHPWSIIQLISVLLILPMGLFTIFYIRESYVISLVFLLVSVYTIISSYSAWGLNPLGHEDYLRDTSWAESMCKRGYWKPESIIGVYAVFPFHAFILYAVGVVAVPSLPINTVGLIISIALKLIIIISVYIFIKRIFINVLFNSEVFIRKLIFMIYFLIVLSLFTFIVPAAQTYSGALLVLIITTLSFTDTNQRTITVLSILITLAMSMYHISETLFLILFSITNILTNHFVKNKFNINKAILIIFVAIPVAWYTFNSSVFGQVSGFLSTFLKALFGHYNLEKMEFVATLQLYTSPMWLLKYYPIILGPIYIALYIIYYKWFKYEKIHSMLVPIQLTAFIQFLLGLFISGITRSSTYYRYLVMPIEYLIPIFTVYYIFTIIFNNKTIKMFLLIFVAFLTMNTSISLLHHTSAPVLHLDKDLVHDTISEKLINMIKSIVNVKFMLHIYTINLPYGTNPYGTPDYWVIKYHLLVKKDIFYPFMALANKDKKPLGAFLYNYFLTTYSFRANIIFSSYNSIIIFVT